MKCNVTWQIGACMVLLQILLMDDMLTTEMFEYTLMPMRQTVLFDKSDFIGAELITETHFTLPQHF